MGLVLGASEGDLASDRVIVIAEAGVNHNGSPEMAQRLVDPPGPGFARLTVIDATGAADTVVIRVQ